MTSAKPNSMAAQNDAPDDLIAELARLMADDARGDQGARPAPPAPAPIQPSIRIPGDAPATSPAPRFDFSASAPSSEPRAAGPQIRIPGDQRRDQAPSEVKAEPFRLDFGNGMPSKPAGPTTSLAAAPSAPADSAPAPALDEGGLADLIAAELANDMAANPEPTPAAPGPARTTDNFGVAPVFGLSAPASEPELPETPAEVIIPESVRAHEAVVPAPRTAPTVAASVAPVVTVAAAAPVAAPPQSDALRDIERLVGPAVNRSRDEAPRAPSPALRSLATPTLPPSQPEPASSSVAPAPQSVDDAILAAAAATGARVEWVGDHHTQDADDVDVQPVLRPRRAPFGVSRAVAGPVVAVSLLALAGFGLYWALGQGATPSGPAPLIVADTTPVREVPEPVEREASQSVVFNEISGGTAPAEEQIVSRDQADEEVVTQASAAAATPVVPSGAITSSGVLTGADEATLNPNDNGIVNRQVRTVTVRPDGTIVSGEDSMAGSTMLPVDRPEVPEVPGADFSTPDLIAQTIGSTEGTATGALPAISAPDAAPAVAEPATPTTPVVQPGTVVPVVDQSGAAIAGRTTTVPMQRPSDFAAAAAAALAANSVPATTATPQATAPAATGTGAGMLPPPPALNALAPTGQTAAPAAPAATPAQPQAAATAPAPTATTGTAAAYVQLSSQRTEEAARATAQDIVTRFGPVFGGANIEIVRADLGERGVYYRVLVPADSRNSAANICNNVRAAGGDCVLL